MSYYYTIFSRNILQSTSPLLICRLKTANIARVRKLRGLVVKLAYHVSLSRRRSPVRIRSGPPEIKKSSVRMAVLFMGEFMNSRYELAKPGRVPTSHAQKLPHSFEHGKCTLRKQPSGRYSKRSPVKLVMWTHHSFYDTI